MFKVLNKILGTNTIWDFVLQRSGFNQDHELKDLKLFSPCANSHKKGLEEEIIDFMKKDMPMSQLCRINTFSVVKIFSIML